MIVATPTLVPALAPVERALATVRRRRGAEGTRGLVPGLVVPGDHTGWFPAGDLLRGPRGDGHDDLGRLLDVAKQRWGGSPHAAAALAWRSYTHWLAMPVVLGWALARRVLLVEPDDVLVRVDDDRQLLTLGWRRVRLAVLPDDPLVTSHPLVPTESPLAVPAGPMWATDAQRSVELTVVGSEPELLGVLHGTLRGAHLDPLLAQLTSRVRLGARTLLGSLASAVAYSVIRGVEAPDAELTATADTLLSALDVADLVEFEPGPDGPAVRRRTCCLAFTLPEPKICASCCLRR